MSNYLCFPDRIWTVSGLADDDFSFNCSLLSWKGERLLAWRKGIKNAEVWISKLDDQFNSTKNQRLQLPTTADNSVSCEDPRLFVFENRLHCEYVGFNGTDIRICVAELDESFGVVRNWTPAYSRRGRLEKNWGMFESSGKLHAVYSIQPHRVLRIEQRTVIDEFEVDVHLPWSHGLLRGGAPPVLKDGVWWSFFHGTLIPADRQLPRSYSIGCYTFENRSPFRPISITPQPILFPNPSMQPTPKTHHVVFPCGAVFDSGKWLVSYGDYHRTCRVAEFDHTLLQRAMVNV